MNRCFACGRMDDQPATPPSPSGDAPPPDAQGEVGGIAALEKEMYGWQDAIQLEGGNPEAVSPSHQRHAAVELWDNVMAGDGVIELLKADLAAMTTRVETAERERDYVKGLVDKARQDRDTALAVGKETEGHRIRGKQRIAVLEEAERNAAKQLSDGLRLSEELGEAQLRIAELENALWRYGHHIKPECTRVRFLPCVCGFQEALATPQTTADAEGPTGTSQKEAGR